MMSRSGEFRTVAGRDYCRPAVSVKPETAGGGRLNGRVKKYLRRRFNIKFYCLKVAWEGSLRNFAIAPEFAGIRAIYCWYDAVIQVGGSNYVDLYGLTPFEYPLCVYGEQTNLYGGT